MLRFVTRRLAMLVLTLLVASFAIYASLSIAPGDPLSVLTGGRTLPPAALATLRARYHLNDPLLVQYWHWLTGALHGDLGTSIALRESVNTLIGERAGVTFELVAYASVLILLFGIGSGLLAGLRRGLVDTSVIAGTTVLAAIPSFVAAIALISFFAVRLGWFPALGAGTGGLDRLWHLTLPAIALALSALAIVARVTRVSVREEMGREHVQTAVSRGLPWHLVIRRHVLRNASIPITTVTGITIASLIALSAVVERAFSLNGLGSALVSAAASKDFAVVQGISLVLVAAFVVTNTIVDLLYAVLDPRVALGSRAE
ncbi:MAG TPA: ABC transporter permease [Solirubrobacteraceae bacterium]|nr:ABC transporter permease [Solirubrobacteraceae bacterium]